MIEIIYKKIFIINIINHEDWKETIVRIKLDGLKNIDVRSLSFVKSLRVSINDKTIPFRIIEMDKNFNFYRGLVISLYNVDFENTLNLQIIR